jgi:hypothetical protein
MSREEPLTGESFEQKLGKLRIKIDLLPESQRPHLADLAETIARQHRQLQHRTSHDHDAD